MALEFRNPRYTKDGRIDIELNHPEYGWIPFTSDPNDVEAHCRELFASAKALGPAPYEPPPLPVYTDEEHAEFTRAERNRLLRLNVDPIVSNPLRWNALTVEEQESLKVYRDQLLNISKQDGWPVKEKIVWPSYPL